MFGRKQVLTLRPYDLLMPSWLQVPVTGLQTPFRGGTVQDLAKEVLELSKGGLSRRGLQEESFIAELVACAETGQVPADTWLQSYNSTWGGSVDPYYVDGAF